MDFTRDKAHSQEYPAPQQVIITSGGIAVVVIAMFLFSIIILYATSRNSDSAPFGIIGSVAFFLLGTPMGILAVNRGWESMYRVHQEQQTIRYVNELQVQQWRVASPPQLEYIPPASPQYPPAGGRFVPPVPAVDRRIKIACANFVTALFDDEGRPNPRLILPETSKRPGQIQAKKPGGDALDYLLSLGIVRVGEGSMLFYNVDHYPTLHDAILAIKREAPAGRGGQPPSNPPLHPPYLAVGEVS